MVDRNDELLREVEEELRRERYEKLWDRYGTYVLGAAFLFVAVVGGMKYLDARRIAAAEAAGSTYVEALRLNAAGKVDEGAKMLETLVKDQPGGYGALAELQQAGALLKSSRPLDAIAVYDKLAKSSSVDPMLKSFAALQAATLRVGEADFTEMQNRLNDLDKPDGAFRHSARELLGLAALKAGRLDEARKALGSLLGDGEAPKGALDRARVMLASIAASELAKASGEPGATAAPEPGVTPAVTPEDTTKGGDGAQPK